MPTYTYACRSCDAEIERRQSFSEARLTVCESCGGQLRRVMHPVGIVFKGSGFHNTDYRKSANGQPNASGDGEKSDATTSDAKAGDTKASESKESTPAKSDASNSTAGETSTTKTKSV